jgi:hypothetical protein
VKRRSMLDNGVSDAAWMIDAPTVMNNLSSQLGDCNSDERFLLS